MMGREWKRFLKAFVFVAARLVNEARQVHVRIVNSHRFADAICRGIVRLKIGALGDRLSLISGLAACRGSPDPGVPIRVRLRETTIDLAVDAVALVTRRGTPASVDGGPARRTGPTSARLASPGVRPMRSSPAGGSARPAGCRYTAASA